MKALLIIHMQAERFKPYSIQYDAFGSIKNINEFATQFQEFALPVIFIQQDGSNGNCFLPHSKGWVLLRDLDRPSNDIIMAKTANDAFDKTALQSFLTRRRVDELFITGCATDFCVDITAKLALS